MVLKGEIKTIVNECYFFVHECVCIMNVFMFLCVSVFLRVLCCYFEKIFSPRYTCLMYSAISASDIFALPNVLMLKAHINNSRLALVALSDTDAEYTAVRAKTDSRPRYPTQLILKLQKNFVSCFS